MAESENAETYVYGQLHWAAGLWNVLGGMVMLLGSGAWLLVALGNTVLGPTTAMDWVGFAAALVAYPLTVVAGVAFLRAGRDGRLIGRWCNVVPGASAGALLLVFVASLLDPTTVNGPFEFSAEVLEEWGAALLIPLVTLSLNALAGTLRLRGNAP